VSAKRPSDRGRRSPLAGSPAIRTRLRWAYNNHGFVALGRIVEDGQGLPVNRYLRERAFAPLGMEHTDLIRSECVRSQLATGYVLRSRGPEAVADREVPTLGGGIHLTAADVARFVAGLQRPYAGQQDLVLKPAIVASMFEPHFQLDPRLPGMDLETCSFAALAYGDRRFRRVALEAVKLIHTLARFSIESCMLYVLWAVFQETF
jgi:CubicO group peptidase (beta-lactamase class C family)